jgi:hypothetical protein
MRIGKIPGLRLVREMKIFGCHIGCAGGCWEGFQILIKNKLQNPSGNCETNLMILINPSLAHVGTVALKAFH